VFPGCSLQKIIAYLESVELEQIGLSERPKAGARRKVFAADLRRWFEERWAKTPF
jgi:hypothetical protein